MEILAPGPIFGRTPPDGSSYNASMEKTGRTGKALHDRIRSDFESRIRSGRLKPGDRLPTEHELMIQYDCSRMTVNKALFALSAGGLIERRKGAGSFVARPHMQSMVHEMWDFAAEIRGRGQTYAYRSIKRALQVPRNEEERLLGGGKKLLLLKGLHLADGVPFGVERRLVSVEAVPEIVEVDFTDTPPGTWMLDHVPWTDTETRVTAILANGETAKLLRVPAGTPCISLERRTWRKAERFAYAQQIFRGEGYDLVMRFRPGATAFGDSVAGKNPREI